MARSRSDNRSLICESRDDNGYRAVFEDNGKVAYLYLLAPSGSILTDVWVYNRGKAPTLPEWQDPAIRNPKSRLPFANPKGYASERGIAPVTRCEELAFVWSKGDTPTDVFVTLKIRRAVVAKLMAGSKPGWAKMAIRDGPLAKVMT